jgi:galactosamine-6-phosphate isomerase
MEIRVFKNYEELSKRAAHEIASTIQSRRPGSVICLASGHTPQRTCEIFVEDVRNKNVDVSEMHFIGLDEWVGIDPDDPGSCHYFFQNNIIKPLNLQKDNYHLFNVMATNLHSECIKMDNLIAQLGVIDLMVVGIGMNGHIGFNEPGVPFDLTCHIVQLDHTTQEVGQKYFSGKKELKSGITLGLAHVMQARKVLLLANGRGKAAIVSRAVREDVSDQVPASILQTHPNSVILLDEEAASKLADSK